MALNPIAYTENVVRSFLRYQLTAYPFADTRLHGQIATCCRSTRPAGRRCSRART